jgi:hypothetical protein
MFVCPCFKKIYDFAGGISRWCGQAYVYMVFVSFEFLHDPVMVFRHGLNAFSDLVVYVEITEYLSSIFGTKDEMIVYCVSTVSARAISVFHAFSIT